MSGEVLSKLPNALTFEDMVANGMSAAEASDVLHKRVFGDNFRRDAEGKPIEQGMGSTLHPTPQHTEALQRANARSFNPPETIGADVIAKAVEAGVKAGIAHAEKSEQF